ncbi:MAG: ParB/RepB/Spo0J family partition protein [Planctomycetaceae bacterium]|nr:ParB/RepB/Spo0J family partition protein [Planctomycetaceae bacterium]
MSARTLQRLPLDRLMPDPGQPRKAFCEESLAGLARTLAEGQLQPILAYRRGEQLIILDGERRWRAARMAGLEAVDVVVVELEEGEDALEKALVANLQRDDLSPIEKARAIARLMERAELPAARVAERLGLSAGNVSRLLALLELPESVQGQVDRKEIGASTAYQITQAGDAEAQLRLAAEAADKKLSREAVAARVKREASGTTPSGKGRTRCLANLGLGRSVALSGPGLDSVETLIAWLEELLTRARKARPRGMALPTFLALLRDESKAAERQPGSEASAAGGGGQ